MNPIFLHHPLNPLTSPNNANPLSHEFHHFSTDYSSHLFVMALPLLINSSDTDVITVPHLNPFSHLGSIHMLLDGLEVCPHSGCSPYP